MRKIFTLLLSLILLPYMAGAETVGAFEVTGGTQGTDYTYTAATDRETGYLTVNDGADITISNTNPSTATTDRIVIASGATATITLSGVNIKSEIPYRDHDFDFSFPAIDISNGATLIINLAEGTTNSLAGGNSQTRNCSPGIHVPTEAAVIIQGSGILSVTGGTSTTSLCGSGIGGNADNQYPEGCGTVLILGETVTVKGGTNNLGGAAVDIGGGISATGSRADDGQGIRPNSDGTFYVYGNLELPCDITIPHEATVVIPDGASLTVPDGTTLTNNGTILVQGGEYTNNGTLQGDGPDYPSEVTVSFSRDGQPLTDNIATYGNTITITATMKRQDDPNTLISTNSDDFPDYGKANFYLSEMDKINKLNLDAEISIVETEQTGVYTASYTVTLSGDKWKPSDSPYTIIVAFGGEESDSSHPTGLAPNTGRAQLTVSKIPSGLNLTVPTENLTYDGQAKTATATVTGPEGATAIITYYTDEAMSTSVESAVNAGTYYVKATYEGNDIYESAEQTGQFTITPAPAVLEYAKTEVRKQVGNEAFTNELTNESSILVNYSSSDETVATVDANGEVTILAAGTTTITATDNDLNYEAEEATYTLVVDLITLEEGSGISITGGQQEVEFDGTNTTMTLTATVTVSDGLGTGRKWTWASSNPKVAVVPEHGDEAEGAMSQANDVTECNSTATVTIKGAGEAKITATYTDSKYKGSVEFVLTVTEPEEPDTPVTPDYPDYYNIMVEECEGVTVETSSTVVREGQSMTFTVDVAEGYTSEDMTVKVKRSLFGTTDIIKPNDEGIYEIKNIYTDIYITVAGVEEEEEETPTGMEDVEGVKVYAKDGSIYVQTPKQEQVQIISISGAVLKNETQVGLQRYDLPRGIYIICIREERFKVRN